MTEMARVKKFGGKNFGLTGGYGPTEKKQLEAHLGHLRGFAYVRTVKEGPWTYIYARNKSKPYLPGHRDEKGHVYS